MGLYENIKALCDDRKLPITRAEEELGFSRGSLGKLREQESISSARLAKIAEYFNVPIDYIVTGKETESVVLSSSEKRLLSYYRALTDHQRTIIDHTARALSDKTENEVSA